MTEMETETNVTFVQVILAIVLIFVVLIRVVGQSK
jgi:hypothetical protein